MAKDGFAFRLLRVDLSAGTHREDKISGDWVRRYLGGSGLAAALIAEQDVASINPLGPENPLVWMTGPFGGTPMPSSGRVSVCAISPLTGIWGESNSGGFFAPKLRIAGFDGLLVTGRSATPVVLAILDGQVQILPDDSLLGLDTYETQEAVRALVEREDASVACIGTAGEQHVLYAAVLNDHGRAAGRCGLGAVMGSKNLKAVAVAGDYPVPIVDEEGLRGTARAIRDAIEEDIACQAIRMAGTAGYLDMAIMYGDLPVRGFRLGEWAPAAQLSGVRMTDEFLVRGRSCFGCTVACGRETRSPQYGLDCVDGPEYETLGALGSLLEIDDLEAVIYANHLCNTLGLDTISTGVTLALACELAEDGLLSKKDAGEVDLRFGSTEMLETVIPLIASREGVGELLAGGSAALAGRCGVPERAVTVKRLEAPMHDPRAFSGMAVSYALSPRGACHMQGDVYSVETGQLSAPELGIEPGDRLESSVEKGRMAARTMIWRTVYNALNLCQFVNPTPERILKAIEQTTGWSLSPEDLLQSGREILRLKREINRKRGMDQQDDRLPDVFLRGLPEGGTQGVIPDLGLLLAGAHSELGSVDA